MAQKSIALSDKPVTLSARIQDYIQLTKFRLSSLVVFSAAMGYIIAEGAGFQWSTLLLLMLGGFLVTGSSNAFNQVIERDLDKLMDRTANRPLPAGRMSVPEALVASVLMGVSGVLILWLGINALCGILSLVSLVIYTTIYTPAKRVTPFAVLIGAFREPFRPCWAGWPVKVRSDSRHSSCTPFSSSGSSALLGDCLGPARRLPEGRLPHVARTPRARPFLSVSDHGVHARSGTHGFFCHWHFTSPVGSPPCCWQPVESTFPAGNPPLSFARNQRRTETHVRILHLPTGSAVDLDAR